MKIRMTNSVQELGAAATESDVENFKAAAEQAAAEMGHEIEWGSGNTENHPEISEQIFNRSIEIGW